jgi:acetoin:2,6-dichlorophenolindophenol oxidoreductase subunit alpha
MYRKRLLQVGFAEATLRELESEAMKKVNEATEAAKASPVPGLDVIEKDVWANGGAAWRN